MDFADWRESRVDDVMEGDDNDSEEERQRLEEEEAELYSKLHYAEHCEFNHEEEEEQPRPQSATPPPPPPKAPSPTTTNIKQGSGQLPPSDDIQRDILEAKMNKVGDDDASKEELDSGQCSLKSGEDDSKMSAESQEVKVTSKYDDNKVNKADKGQRSESSDSSDSESDDGIQIVGRVQTPKKPPLAVVTLESSDDSELELEAPGRNDLRKRSKAKASEAKKQPPNDATSKKKAAAPNKKPLEIVTISDGATSSSDNSTAKAVESRNKAADKAISSKSNAKQKPRVAVEVEDTVKANNAKNLISRQSSSDSDTTSSSSDEDDDGVDGGLSLNLTGNRKLPSSGSGVDSGKPSFSEITSREWFDSVNVKASKIDGWTEEMHQFYDDVNYEEADLTIQQTLDKMPDDPKLWYVSAQDRYAGALRGSPSSRGRPRYFARSVRCNNCNRQGHLAKDCTEKVRPVACYMCGEAGHINDNCPNTKCLRCGMPDTYYSNNGCMHCRRLANADCFNCGATGHTKTTCPDNWRRYHATLSGNKVVRPNANDVTSKKESVWCCNCAKQGHYVHQCRAYSYSPYPPNVPFVVTYNDPIRPESLNVSSEEDSDEDGASDVIKKTGKANWKQLKAGMKRSQKMREMKTKRGEFLSLCSTPNNAEEDYDDDVTMTSSPKAKKRKFSSASHTPSSFKGQKQRMNTEQRLEKAKKTLEELLADQDQAEAASSSKKWRKQKRNNGKVMKAINPSPPPPPKTKNSKKKEAKSLAAAAAFAERQARKGHNSWEVNFPRTSGWSGGNVMEKVLALRKAKKKAKNQQLQQSEQQHQQQKKGRSMFNQFGKKMKKKNWF